MSWKKVLIVVVVLLGCLAGIYIYVSAQELEEVEVVYTVDGDTLVVRKGEEQFTVRLIGVDTPESKNCAINECTIEGENAAEYTKEYFQDIKIVYLEYDRGRYDKYGRTLAYVWLRNDANTRSFTDFRKYCYNAIVLENTSCVAKYYSPNGKHRKWLEDIEQLKNAHYNTVKPSLTDGFQAL